MPKPTRRMRSGEPGHGQRKRVSASVTAAEPHSGASAPDDFGTELPVEPPARTHGPKAEKAEPSAQVTPPDTKPRISAPVAPQPENFDEALYRALNPDAARAVAVGAVRSGREHWLQVGRMAGRAWNWPLVLDEGHYSAAYAGAAIPSMPNDFGAAAYSALNPDIHAVVGHNYNAAFGHWMRYGRFEGRLLDHQPSPAQRQPNPFRLFGKPFGVTFYAPFTATSGLGTAARGYLQALQAAGIPTQPINVDFCNGHPRVTAEAATTKAAYRIQLIHVNADMLGRFTWLFDPGHFDDSYTIGLWAWELNVLRPDWFGAFAGLDEVWTPSAFNSAAVSPVAPVPVVTINHVVTPRPPGAARHDRASFNLPPGFLFLTAFDAGSSLARKHPDAVLDAFATAFGERADVHLVIKMHSVHQDSEAARALLRRSRVMPNVHIRTETMSEAEMHGLRACADCFVSAHRAEGFGLNIAESMLAAKPVIATAYSGNMDFTTPDNSFLVPYDLVAIEEQAGPYLPGYLWAQPNVAALSMMMRRVVARPGEAQAVAERGASTVRKHLSAQAVGYQMAARLRSLGLDQVLPDFVQNLGRAGGIKAPPREATAYLPGTQASRQPVLSVVVPVYNVEPEWLHACIRSVQAQTYSRWELCLCDDASTSAGTRAALDAYRGTDPRIRIKRLAVNGGIAVASNEAAMMATGTWLIMLDNDDELTPDALAEIAAAVAQDPLIDALYSDEDKIAPDGSLQDTYFKPDWSPEHIESVMYTLHPLTVRTSLFLRLGGFRREFAGAQDWDLMLRISRETDRIHHVPKILYHWRMIPGSSAMEVDAKPGALEVGAHALADHVAAKYGAGNAWVESAPLAGHYRVRHAIRGEPPVTLVITTDNRSVQLPGRPKFVMVANLVNSLLTLTGYPNTRILVVDNGNTPPALARRYRAAGVRLASYGGPIFPFNYADKANFSLRQVETEHLVMLNDDMEALHADWLTALLELSQNPEIGACGGRLLHADGTIQHVGTVLGVGGGSAHVYHGFPGDFVGYNGFTHVIRNYSALTGACLATRRSVLNEVGGWDRAFAIDYNDVDLCLKMRRNGYRVVYTPYSSMLHFESKTAVRTSQDPSEVALFRSRWRAVVDNDPFYNPNLSRAYHDFSLV